MSQRLKATSGFVLRFSLSHRILFVTVVAMLVLGGVGISHSSAVKSTLSVLADNSATSTKASAPPITVHAAGRDKPYLNFVDGHSMAVAYRGDSALAGALQNDTAQGRSLAAADLDRNGTLD